MQAAAVIGLNVRDQHLGLPHPRKPADDRLRLLVAPAAAIDEDADEVGIVRDAPGGRHHRPVEPAFRRKNAGGVDEHELGVVVDRERARFGAGAG